MKVPGARFAGQHLVRSGDKWQAVFSRREFDRRSDEAGRPTAPTKKEEPKKEDKTSG